MANSRQHAFRRMFRGLVAGVGLVLVMSTVSAVPAAAGPAEPQQRGILDGVLDGILNPVLPIPGIDGVGSITKIGGGYTCTSATDLAAIFECLPIPLAQLGATETVLKAVPGTDMEFAGWDGCPQEAGELCTIGSGLLTSLVAPIANFVPADGGIPCSPLPLPCDEEPTEPDTRITAKPDAETTEVDATFAFEAVPAPAAGVESSFQCKLVGPGSPGIYEACVSPSTYTGLEPGAYTFSVHAIVDGVKDPSDATASWKVTEETTDEEAGAPQTHITESPRIRKGGWLLQSFAQFKFGSDAKNATYQCGLNGDLRGCMGGQALYRTLASATHTFSVAATAGGKVDRTPAKRKFTVPKNNSRLKHSKAGKSWDKKRGKRYFLDTYSETRTKGAWIQKGSRSIKKIALVATKGRGHGTVKVFLGKRLLKKVSLRANRTRTSQLIPIKTFRTKKRGAVRIVVVSRNKVVRIEGLGIATR